LPKGRCRFPQENDGGIVKRATAQDYPYVLYRFYLQKWQPDKSAALYFFDKPTLKV
jgi:hypothetical protein